MELPGKGWESQIATGQKGPPRSPRKISAGEIFCRLLFFQPGLLVPIEAPSKRFPRRLAQSEVPVQISGKLIGGLESY
jgi:hypothetical protein